MLCLKKIMNNCFYCFIMMIMNDIDCGNDFDGNYEEDCQFTWVAPLHTEICEALRDTHFQHYLNDRFTQSFSNTCLIT